jgi:hypothetical protein
VLPWKLQANSRILWGKLLSPSLKTYSDLYCKSATNNHRCNYYMENKMTSLKTYLCVLKMFDAKTYLWHLQAFLISGAKIKNIKLHFNWSLTKIRKTIYGTYVLREMISLLLISILISWRGCSSHVTAMYHVVKWNYNDILDHPLY